jgi:hypothetical protein
MFLPLSASFLSKLTTVKAVNVSNPFSRKHQHSFFAKDTKHSSPVVGSSKKSKGGFVIISIAIQHLFFSPPDSPFNMAFPKTVSLAFSSCNMEMSSWMRCSRCSRGKVFGRRNSALSRMA